MNTPIKHAKSTAFGKKRDDFRNLKGESSSSDTQW